MYDFSGAVTGVQQYRPNGSKDKPNDPREGKYFSRVTSGKLALFGLESLLFSREIFLVGGMFKAATLHRLGYSALHVSSAAPALLKPQLGVLGRRFYAIGDNDDEGVSFVRRWGGWQSPCDVDEMTDEDVHTMIYYETSTLDAYNAANKR